MTDGLMGVPVVQVAELLAVFDMTEMQARDALAGAAAGRESCVTEVDESGAELSRRPASTGDCLEME